MSKSLSAHGTAPPSKIRLSFVRSFSYAKFNWADFFGVAEIHPPNRPSSSPGLVCRRMFWRSLEILFNPVDECSWPSRRRRRRRRPKSKVWATIIVSDLDLAGVVFVWSELGLVCSQVVLDLESRSPSNIEEQSTVTVWVRCRLLAARD